MASQVILDLLQQTLDSGEDSSKSTIVHLKLEFRNSHKASLALEEVPFQILFLFDVESDDQGLLPNFSTIFCLSSVVPTIVTGEAHNDDIREVGHASSASLHGSRLKTRFARHLETQRLVLHQCIFFEGLHKVEHVAGNLNLSFLFHSLLLLGVFNAVAHLFKLF